MPGKCFDRTFVINLDDRLDKWENMVARLTAAGISNYERFPGVKRNLCDFPASYYAGMDLKAAERFGSERYLAGACGCKMSHFKAISLARDRGYQSVLILEDDAMLADGALSRFSRAWRELEGEKWDMLYLGGRHRSLRKPWYHSPNLVRVRCTYQTHAYAVHHSFYDVLLDKISSSSNEIDVMYADEVQPFNRCYGVFPNVLIQDSESSDITGESLTGRRQGRPWYLSPVLGVLLREIRNLTGNGKLRTISEKWF
jgi:GR25 family glycosyltransferase involved in LPS biosynthesis